MKAISINQPWAWCIVNGYKPIENRDWATQFRGTVLIHAGKKFKEDNDPEADSEKNRRTILWWDNVEAA